MLVARLLALFGVALVSVSCSPAVQPIKRDEPSSSNSTEIDQTICGKIIDARNNGNFLFYAPDAYECLRSVPFNGAVALRFIDYYNTTLQFQSTLSYLKDPPKGYRQPPTDVAVGLEKIRNAVRSGYYTSQLAFETDIQKVVHSMHDLHVELYAGILSVFSFGSLYYISSVSVDGKQAPQVYITDDLIAHRNNSDFEISPIVAINGEETAKFLTDFAALNSFGLVEPHADWNSLMSQPPQDILGEMNTFSTSATFYPGDDLTFTLENGTTHSTPWVAFYNDQDCTGPLSTPGDFYNFFVLGLYPASYEDSNCTNFPASTKSDSDYQRSWSNQSYGAYPTHADIVQTNLSTEHGGVVAGYFLHDISVAVLSIPSFYQFNDDYHNFARAVQSFIDGASAAAMSRVIIDLQQNSGGAVFLAIDTFKRFFPNIEPFVGSRRRIHPLADELGEVITNWWETLDPNDPAKDDIELQRGRGEWVITNRLKAETDQTFSSWSEYYSQQSFNGDTFSEIERYNLSNYVPDSSTFGGVPYGYNDSDKASSSGKWLPEDIVILTDGLCSSACSLFVEMMKTQAGVHTIVMGGRPEAGPMQYASGNRGARYYSTDSLDEDINFVRSRTDNTTTVLPPVRESGIYILYAGFNLRDQIRENGTVPLQFLYEPATCRLYYTVDNVYNMTKLWQDVTKAAWHNSSMCVQGSVNVSSSDFNFSVSTQSLLDELSIEMPNTSSDDSDYILDLLITDGSRTPRPDEQKSNCRKGTPSTGCQTRFLQESKANKEIRDIRSKIIPLKFFV